VTEGARVDLLDLTPAQAESALREFATAQGFPPYRGSQAARHLWAAPEPTFDAMTDLPKAFRVLLESRFALPRLALSADQLSSDGTRKFLFTLSDGQAIETVAIPEDGRLTLCISSQAGCALQCAFCATGAMGFARNLAAHEIAGQVREMSLLDPPQRPTNIVFMGMG
jgi:23S rRNA (adenine2503-C2)-methyltransferase